MRASWSTESDHGVRGTREATIRLILDRAYHRLRTMHNQGRRVDGAERLLNLVRDLRVVPLDGVTIRIPLVYADVWDLKVRVGSYLKRRNKKFTTMFASPSETEGLDPVGAEINKILVDALNNYLSKHHRYGLLLDVMRRNPISMKETDKPPDYDFLMVQSEIGGAFYRPDRGFQHPLFLGISDRIPDLLLEVQALVRIIFPLGIPGNGQAQKMGAIVLGVALRNADLEGASAELDPRLLAQVKLLTEVLINEIPKIYGYFEQSGVRRRRRARNSETEDIERKDDIHCEVDLLHKQIADLASRLRLDGWNNLADSSRGYNFLIAFRSLDKETLEGRLRYCLTDLNKKALMADLESGVFLSNQLYERLSSNIEGLFDPTSRKNDLVERLKFAERGRELIRDLIVGESKETALNKLVRAIEENHYPVNLTPGYHVMSLGYPEIVKNWLRDPRAKDFQHYPPLLLTWESLAIPEGTEIYYSPIAEGSICFGICGVRSDLLYSDGGPELQELVDKSGPWLREIICNEHIDNLKRDLFNSRVEGTAGESLWKEVLWHFRDLAYYYLPDRNDYFTMILDEQAAQELDRIIGLSHTKWGGEDKLNWQELHGRLSYEAISFILSVEGRRPAQRDGVESCLVSYLRKNRQEGDAQLYQMRLVNAPTARLLVLVPERRYRQRATSLLRRFSMACESALASYADGSVSLISASELGHQCVYLMPLLRAGLASCKDQPVDQIRLLTEVLQNEMNYFTNKIPEIKNGKPITLQQLFDLMVEITTTIRWALKTARAPLKGHLEDVSRENLRTLERAISLASLNEHFQALKNRSLGISRSAALLLMWETAFNLCKHSKAKISFSVSPINKAQIRLTIESGSSTTAVRKSGRFGVAHLQKVASKLGVGFDSGRLIDNHRVFHAAMTFPSK